MAKPQKKRDGGDVSIARVSAIQAIVVALITTVGGAAAGYYFRAPENKPAGPNPGRTEVNVNVVPENRTTTYVEELQEDPEQSQKIQVLRDISIFDLRSWRQVPDSARTRRYSPVNYINYLHLRKTQPIDTLKAHYSTTGFVVDLRSITHSARVLRERSPRHRGAEEKEFAVHVDINDVPIGQEFLVVIEGTYWNSFQDPTQQWAATYIDENSSHLSELALIVLLPQSKPFVGDVAQWIADENMENKQPYRGRGSFFKDGDRRFIYWSIENRSANRHYGITWNW